MPIFQTVQKTFDSVGLNPKLDPLNRKLLSILITNFMAIILQLIYLLHVADSSQQYLECIYVVTVGSGILLSIASTILIRDKLFLYIDTLDEVFNESKS